MIYGMWFNSSGGGGGGATSIGDLLVKTGQTVSYRGGDDGGVQAGRKVDFTTLKADNPFGNASRFTDELGGSTYANDIVIDWSTYDGSTVLGYYNGNTLNANWNNSIDNALALSVGSFTSGWRLANIRELQNISNYSTIHPLNYAPFSRSGVVRFFSSSTDPNNTGNVFVLDYSSQTRAYSKLASYSWIATRDFTVTGTTLT